jgi:hypothetical protein
VLRLQNVFGVEVHTRRLIICALLSATIILSTALRGATKMEIFRSILQIASYATGIAVAYVWLRRCSGEKIID